MKILFWFLVAALFALVLAGCRYAPDIVVHQYGYVAEPPSARPGTPPAPPEAPVPASYPTVYPSAWDDPTLVVAVNQSARRVRLNIDNQPEIVLAPYQATDDLHLGVGEHRVRVVIEKPTAASGILEVIRFLTFRIHPEGRSQIVYINDY